jgi:hypothetical protein
MIRRPPLLVLAALLAAANLAAQERDPHAVQPERPTVATHAGTVAPGWIELETGAEFDHARGAWSVVAPAVIKIGIAPRVQFSIFGGFTRPAGDNLGVGELAAGVKFRLAEDLPLLGDFAVLPAIKFPLADQRHGTGTTDLSLLAISSHQFGSVSMDVNAGYTRRSGDGTAAPKNAWIWAVAAGTPVQGAFGVTAELFGYPRTTGPAGADGTVALLGGPVITLHPWWTLDFGGILKLRGPQPNGIYAGGVYNFGRLWR